MPGMTLSINNKLYRVESSVKVTVPKGTPFIKTKLRELNTNELIEKSFKLDQTIKDVAFSERDLEFLYPEGKDYLFIDIGTLDQVLIPSSIIGEKINYLKEGTELKASFYGDTIFTVELPQFLEIMAAKIEGGNGSLQIGSPNKVAVLETGARVEVPPFIEVGDIIKVDTKTDEYIQRV
ncbi:MAG TPA: elongation factor P [Parachlamydiaceae bacterium]|nr:elongation factor P [Parachlamydiaceae bacterium]